MPLSFWIGLAAVALGAFTMHHFAYRWWSVVLVFVALCFAAVVFKGL